MRDHSRMQFRPATVDDVSELVAVQEEAAVVALADIFPQDRFPFPRQEIVERWTAELHDPDTHVYVPTDDAGRITGFAARRDDEVLHFGTARSTWGTGHARDVHDALVATYPDDLERIRLFVLTENHRARRFWEKVGWRPTGRESRSPYLPYPHMAEYELRLRERGSLPG